MRATVLLTQNTGICPGHVKYMESEGSAEGFFTGKAVYQTTAVDLVRCSPSRHGYEVGCAHIKGELEDYENCDFLCYKNEKSKVFFVNKITSIEKVNSTVGNYEASCRIHFIIDIWHTYSGYIKTGFAYVKRTHPEPGTDLLGAYLIKEPVSPPMAVNDYKNSVLEGAVEGIVGTNASRIKFIAYMSADEKGNANTADTRFRTLQGAPIWCSLKVGSASEIAKLIKSYINQRGRTQFNEIPTLSNIQQIIAAPEDCVKEGLGEWIPSKLTLPSDVITGGVELEWKKLWSPQFISLEITALTNGQTMSLDITKMMKWNNGRTSMAVPQWDLKICITGGLDVQIGLGLWLDGNTMPRSPDESIAQNPFPKIPVYQYMNAPETQYGAQKSAIEGIGGSSVSASIGGAISAYMGTAGGSPTAPNAGGDAGVAASIKANGAPGFFSGVGNAAWGALVGTKGVEGEAQRLESIDNTWGNYSVNATGGAGWQTMMGYTFNTTIKRPTAEGVYMINTFFHRFGYAMERMLKLNFAVNPNYTFLQTSGGTTWTSEKVPATALDIIGAMLNEGLTIWKAEIGSVMKCK